MENKISASALVAMVALATGQPGDLCEKFINELISLVSEALEAGENVRIKGLGTFKLVEIDPRKSVDVATGEEIEIPAHRRVIFVPSKELAAVVNAPFEAFEAEEVADDLPTDELMLEPEEEGLESLDEEDESEADETVQDETVQVAASTSDVNPSPKEENEEDSVAPEGREMAETIVFGQESMLNAQAVADAEQSSRHDSRVIRFGQDNGQSARTGHASEAEAVTSEEADAQEPSEMMESSETGDSPSAPAPIEDDAHQSDLSRSEEESDVIYLSEEEEGVNYAQTASEDAPRRGHFGKGFLLGFITAAVVIALLLLLGIRYGYISPEKIHNQIAKKSNVEIVDHADEAAPPAAVVADSTVENAAEESGIVQPTAGAAADEVPTRPSDEAKPLQSDGQKVNEPVQPKYDTVSTTRYLTTMAQEHYGNYNLWPIIYKENEAILGHPDRIKPGTRVVVPPLSKYNIDPENPEDVAAMKREGVTIYSKFKKK